VLQWIINLSGSLASGSLAAVKEMDEPSENRTAHPTEEQLREDDRNGVLRWIEHIKTAVPDGCFCDLCKTVRSLINGQTTELPYAFASVTRRLDLLFETTCRRASVAFYGLCCRFLRFGFNRHFYVGNLLNRIVCPSKYCPYESLCSCFFRHRTLLAQDISASFDDECRRACRARVEN